jgi:predicted RNA-binding Zn ribbon-like protein
MLDPGTYSGTYEPDGERLCLDFANTVSWRGNDQRHDWLDSYSNLVGWGQLVGVLTDDEAGSLLQEAARRPQEAAQVLERAVALREALYGLFSVVAAGLPPGVTDLDILNAALSRALAHSQLVSTMDGFEWAWVSATGDLERMLWPVAQSAADLLAEGDLKRVGECQGEGCGWLFIDSSRNRSRRWCDMQMCGNRAKAQRHYRRKSQRM